MQSELVRPRAPGASPSRAGAPPRALRYAGSFMAGEPKPPVPEDPQVEIFRRMTPEQKLRAAERLYWSARELKAAWFRSQHPDWTDTEVKKAVRDAFLFHHDE